MNKQNILSKDQVMHIAKLANLNLTEKEVTKFQKQLADILEYFKILNELDTRNIKPTSQVTGLENVFRADEIKENFSQKEALFGTKNKHQGYFKIKAIFD